MPRRDAACRLSVLLGAALCLATAADGASGVVPDTFATIQRALDQAVAGDVIQVKDTFGPFFEKVRFIRGGDPTDGYVTLTAYPGHAPVLDGTNVPGINMVLIDSLSYVKLIGFEIRNNLRVEDGSGVRIVGAGSHIEIRRNRIHDIRGTDAMGITVYGTSTAASISDLVIDQNELYDLEPAQSEALTLNGNIERFVVSRNIVRDVNSIGIDFIGGELDINPDPTKVPRNGICRFNQVSRSRANYGGGFAAGIYVDGGRDIVVEHNTVTASDLGIEVGAENTGVVTSGIIVRNNIIHHNEKVCLVFGGFDASVGRVRNSQFLNNTCYQNDTLGTLTGELWIQWAEDNTVRRNIFYGLADTLMLSEAGSVDNRLDYNFWYSPSGAAAAVFAWEDTLYEGYTAYRAGLGQDVNSRFADPQFVNAADADFHLATGSPAVDRTAPTAIPAAGETDLDLEARRLGARIDIGADEQTSPGCIYTLSARGQSFDRGGGAGVLSVVAATTCNWTASSVGRWISVDGAAKSGNGTVAFTVALSDEGPAVRHGTLVVAGQPFTVAQRGSATAPLVTITGPTSGETWRTTAPRVILDGMALDDTGLKSVVWVNSRGGSGVATGTTSWATGTIPLQDGLNNITVTVTDSTGAQGTDAITVTEDMPPTVVASCSPCAVAPGDVVALTASARDLNQDPLTYQWTAPGWELSGRIHQSHRTLDGTGTGGCRRGDGHRLGRPRRVGVGVGQHRGQCPANSVTRKPDPADAQSRTEAVVS